MQTFDGVVCDEKLTNFAEEMCQIGPARFLSRGGAAADASSLGIFGFTTKDHKIKIPVGAWKCNFPSFYKVFDRLTDHILLTRPTDQQGEGHGG